MGDVEISTMEEIVPENDVMEITMDSVIEQKLAGNYEIAEQMLKDFHKAYRKEGKEAFNNEVNLSRRIKTAKGLCTTDYCTNPIMEGQISCKECYEKRKQWRLSNKVYEKLKQWRLANKEKYNGYQRKYMQKQKVKQDG